MNYLLPIQIQVQVDGVTDVGGGCVTVWPYDWPYDHD